MMNFEIYGKNIPHLKEDDDNVSNWLPKNNK
jgi:hypothetical protein